MVDHKTPNKTAVAGIDENFFYFCHSFGHSNQLEVDFRTFRFSQAFYAITLHDEGSGIKNISCRKKTVQE